MKRLWLLFSQTVTVLLAIWFVLITLKPEWLQRNSQWNPDLHVFEAPASVGASPSTGSLSPAAKKASPSVVSINTTSKAHAAKDPLRSASMLLARPAQTL
jgi:S1-C subfamily serine protease